MKVRHKLTGAVGEVCYTSTDGLGNLYYSIKGSHGFYNISDCEEVKPEPTYRDVTGECSVTDTGIVEHNQSADVAYIPVHRTNGYRLRKVLLYEHDAKLGRYDVTPQWAFIVEKRDL